jgi:hypothetical protein
MLWEYAMPGMGWWMVFLFPVLAGMIATAMWPVVHWVTQPHAHASLSAPLISSDSSLVRQSDARGEWGETPEPRQVHVTLLTAPHCGYSEEAKVTLLRLAHEYPLAIDMVALRTPEGDRLALRSGVLFPPGLFLDDELFSYGLVSEVLLRQELARRSHVRVNSSPTTAQG